MMEDFAGFGPELFAFLEDLRFHNEREWFKAHQDRYETAVRGPALDFIDAMALRLDLISPELTAVAKKSGGSLMRIYRDIRFSKDKTPYKTNVGIQFRHRAGKDVHAPGLYLHMEPGDAFLAAGMWRPASEPLAQIRQAIDERPEAWTAARDAVVAGGGWTLSGESLKRPPRGYSAEHPMIHDIKRKDFIAVRELDEAEVFGPDFPDRAAERYAAATPLMRFLCKAVGLAY